MISDVAPHFSTENALVVQNLVKNFKNTLAVDDLSLEVKGGEIVGLLGPNGAGKSTTFQCLAGLLRPDSGMMTLDGVPLGPDRSQKIALIPETPEVYDMLTIWEHMFFVAKSCHLKSGWEAEAEDLLGRFGIWNKRNELGQSLSKGMRQKTLIAATVLADAPMMLFDEPMIGLDPLGQRELRDIMKDLRLQGTALMMSTHMLASAQAICDRVIIMKSGRMVESGTFAHLQSIDPNNNDIEQIFLELTA